MTNVQQTKQHNTTTTKTIEPQIPPELELVAKALSAGEDGAQYFHAHAFEGIASDLDVLAHAMQTNVAPEEIEAMIWRIHARALAAASLAVRLYEFAEGRHDFAIEPPDTCQTLGALVRI